MSSHLYSIRGMNDLLPLQARSWDRVVALVSKVCREFGYDRMDFPIVGPTDLFCRAIGDATDIVEKEMYSFTDSLSGEKLTLRPEGTACCLRSVAENNMTYGCAQRLWYHGPMFRHERPQKGRYRQFHQIGLECFGIANVDVEIELLLLNREIWRCLGIEDFLSLNVNTLGKADERQVYRQLLVEYFSSHSDLLDDDSRRRLHRNPFRILDSNNPDMQDLISNVPSFFNILKTETQDQYHGFLESLAKLGITYTWNHHLVRGLDYYNGIVFEWLTDRLGSQSAVCAGGRYDGLATQLGYKNIYAVGCAIGIERLVALSLEKLIPDDPVRFYAVHADLRSFYELHRLAEDLRRIGWSVIVHPGQDSLGVQMKKADQLGCTGVLIMGESELNEGSVCVKMLATGQQDKVNFHDLPQFLVNSLK
ncbi:histidine--tRNA ligase [Candidatus Ichthyocystis hellenicum]|uniref:histidine--tRNA ligase n=1 Tax=Candidatus Ichthyocystis hellenicum TaxID=1561003 RepID=UPI000A7420BF|nr:histidine--tRNA ligase [Candidatus Ichthyocystis hellenicum]